MKTPGILLFAFGALAASLVSAADYHVNPVSGSDVPANGSPAAPWRTLGYATTRVSANQGHVIRLSSGTHSISTGLTLPTGVSVVGAGQASTTVLCLTTTTYPVKLISSAPENGNQTISSLTFDGNGRASAKGLYIRYRDNITVRDVTFRNFGETALDAVGSYDATKTVPPTGYIRNLLVERCTFINSAKDFPAYTNGSLNIGGLIDSTVRDCVFRENQGYGIKFFNYGWLKNLRIYGCSFDMPPSDPLWGLDAAIELWNVSDGCEVYNNTSDGWFSFVRGSKGASDHSVRVYGNEITQTGARLQAIETNLDDCEVFYNVLRNCAAGIGIYGSAANVLVHHNIVVADEATNAVVTTRGVVTYISAGHNVSNLRVLNNVFDNVNRGVELQTQDGSDGRIVSPLVANNVFLDSVLNDGDTVIALWGRSNEITGASWSNNVVHNIQTAVTLSSRNSPASIAASANLTANPQLRLSGVSPWNRYAPAFATSLVVDAGLNFGLPYCGAAPDIGVNEHYLAKHEAELSSPVGIGVDVVNMAHYAASNGVRSILFSESVGKAVRFTLPDVPAGRYSVKLRYQQFSQRGIARLTVNGVAVGSPLDFYGTTDTYLEVPVGLVDLAASGMQTFQLTVTGKNAASSSYKLGPDAFTLESDYSD